MIRIKKYKLLLLFAGILWMNNTFAQCTANFTFTQGQNGLVTFTSTSVGTNSFTTYNWNFGNATSSVAVNLLNTQSTYTANGTYTVSLTITSPGTPICNSSISTTISITSVTGTPCNLHTNFSFSQGANGLVNFNNTSTGTVAGTTYTWSFGDNSGSNSISPAHTYSANGSYLVKLYANNNFTNTCKDSTVFSVNVTSYCNLSAGFTMSQAANGLVNFVSTTTGTVVGSIYSWNFGDNTNGSGAFTAHTYTNGLYTVLLTVNNGTNIVPSCSASVTHTLAVTNATNINCNLNANFSSTQGANGLVNFNNTSTGTVLGTTYSWNFGDNSTSNTASPAHTYSANGLYTVTLTANNNFSIACISTKTAVVNVNSYCNLVAGFGFTLGANGLVNFKSTSTGTTVFSQYSWNFGNGSGSGIAPNKVYANGTYTVKLTVTNFSVIPTCTSSITQTLTVSSFSCPLSASFVHTVGFAGQVNFMSIATNTSGSTTYTWNFGDGFISNLINPSHNYISAGAYQVSLKIKDTLNYGCSDTTTQILNITGVPCIANSNFTLTPTNTPKFWNAIPAYPWNVTAASWSWGDGTITNSLYCSHLYSVSATYTICLTVTVSCGASSSLCASYLINKSASGAAGMDILSVNVIPPQTVLGIGSTDKAVFFDFNIYPNPNNGNFQVNISELRSGKVDLEVYNIIGERIYSFTEEIKNEQWQRNIVIAEAPQGIYFMRITNGGFTASKKVILGK